MLNLRTVCTVFLEKNTGTLRKEKFHRSISQCGISKPTSDALVSYALSREPIRLFPSKLQLICCSEHWVQISGYDSYRFANKLIPSFVSLTHSQTNENYFQAGCRRNGKRTQAITKKAIVSLRLSVIFALACKICTKYAYCLTTIRYLLDVAIIQ